MDEYLDMLVSKFEQEYGFIPDYETLAFEDEYGYIPDPDNDQDAMILSIMEYND